MARVKWGTVALVGGVAAGGYLLWSTSRTGDTQQDLLDRLQDTIGGLVDRTAGDSQTSATPGVISANNGATTGPRFTGPPKVQNKAPETARVRGASKRNVPTIDEIRSVPVGSAVVSATTGSIFTNRGLKDASLSALSDKQFAAVPDFVKRVLRRN